jgi:uncharacterized membrane protein
MIARRRFLAKTLTYRVTSLAVTVTVAYLVVGDGGAALGIGLGASLVKMGVYYAHERAWAAALPPGPPGSAGSIEGQGQR